MENLRSTIGVAGSVIEGVGVAVVVLGALAATGLFLLSLRRRGFLPAYTDYRANIARSVLLGLEFLVAGDIIRTVVVHPTLENVGSLALIVLVRTFLSLTLEMEVSGRWPWQRADERGARQV